MKQRAVNPATGKLIQEYNGHSSGQVKKMLKKSERAFLNWSKEPMKKRAALLEKMADLLESAKDELADLMADEMGKVLAEGRSEVEKCASVCRYYAENGSDFLSPETLKSDASNSYVSYQPLGPVLAVMPWNFPFWQVYRFAAPALMAGNVVLLKHAPNVPGCALRIEKLFKDAGFPDGTFQTLLIDTDTTAEVIADRRVKAVTLTGSTKAGSAVAAQAGRHLKKTVLELGGSDPYLILDDADLDQAVEACAISRMINSGQSCIAAKRFIVTSRNYEAFIDKLVAKLGDKKMGEPKAQDSDYGPQARIDLCDNLHEQVSKSIEAGAKPLLGCEKPEGPGAYYPASVLIDVKPGMPAFDEELFGPVAAVIRAEGTDDAIRLANQSNYGLGAAVFTSDEKQGERIAAEQLEAGCCFVNDFVRSDPRLPFGGIGDSGYGRELSKWGIQEFVNIKTVYVK